MSCENLKIHNNNNVAANTKYNNLPYRRYSILCFKLSRNDYIFFMASSSSSDKLVQLLVRHKGQSKASRRWHVFANLRHPLSFITVITASVQLKKVSVIQLPPNTHTNTHMRARARWSIRSRSSISAVSGHDTSHTLDRNCFNHLCLMCTQNNATWSCWKEARSSVCR